MSRRGIRDRLVPAALLGVAALTLVLAFSGPALGYFTTKGSGTKEVTVASLTVPTISSAVAGAGGTVTLTWAKSTAPGPVAYYVTRDGGAPGGNCPTQAEPENELGTCIDSGLEPGTYAYKVVAKYKTWSATSSATTAKVTIGPADHFILAVASTTPSAAAADNLTITAKDSAGSTVTTYKESHSLTFEGASASPSGQAPTVVNSAGSAINFGSATALTFTNGVASVASSKNGVMKLYNAEATTISVSDGSIESEVDPTVTVAPLAMSKLVLSAATTTPAVGAEDGLTTTAQDTYGNVATTYTGSKSLKYSGPVASPSGQAPNVTDSSGKEVAIGTATPTKFVAGVATASEGDNGELTLYKAAAASVKVAEGSITSAAVTITATSGTVASLKLAAATATPVAGAEDALTVTALDSYGNTAAGYTGSKSLKYSGPVASPSGQAPNVTDSSGKEVAIGTATPTKFVAGVATASEGDNGELTLYKAAAATVTVVEGSLTSAAVTITASPASAASLKLAAASTTPVVAIADNLTATALDAYGNTATSYTGAKNLTFSGPEVSPSGTAASVSNSSGTAINVGSATAITFTSGVATVSSTKNGVFKAAKSGATTLSATDGTVSTAGALALTVTAGSAAKYAWSGATISAGTLGSPCLFTCTVTNLGNNGSFTAKVAVTDSLGNVVSNLGTANSVSATATTGSIVTGGSLTIATTGLAESTASFTYKSKASGTFADTITAAKSTGTAYTSATATTSR